MELRFSVVVDVPENPEREDVARATRQFLLKLAAELIQCSVRADESSRGTTKRR